MLLTKDQILSADDLKRETVSVPEWGGDVCIRTMSGAERDRYESQIIVEGKVTRDNIRARLLAMAICDDQGKPLFNESEVIALGAKSSKALDRCFDVAMRLNGLSKEDVKDLEKNS